MRGNTHDSLGRATTIFTSSAWDTYAAGLVGEDVVHVRA